MADLLKKQRNDPASRAVRPIMALLDLLGRRWTLRLIWELRGEPLSSRALRSACSDLSPTVLQTRLDDLRDAGLIEHEAGTGYKLTSLGRELLDAFAPLYKFADHWAEQISDIAEPPGSSKV